MAAELSNNAEGSSMGKQLDGAGVGSSPTPKPKKTYFYEDPWGTHILTEDQILAVYWDFYRKAMLKVNKSHLVSKANCIDDWVVVNWAVEINPPVFQKVAEAAAIDPDDYRRKQLEKSEGWN